MKSSEGAMFIELLNDNTDPIRVWDINTDIKGGDCSSIIENSPKAAHGRLYSTQLQA